MPFADTLLMHRIQSYDIEWRASEGFGVNGRIAVLRHFEDFSEAFEDWRVVAG
jgi:hypothetical protein